MARTRRVSKTMFVIGGVLLVAAILWVLVAVPALVKYPTDVDSSPKYAGTFSLFVNPVSMAPLEEPMKVPLSVNRHIEAIGDESSSSKVVVRETITQKAGDLVDTTQQNQYVMDRRTLKNVKDSRAWAFEPSNVVDRSGLYRLNLPFGTDADDTYPVYKNEIGTSYTMRSQVVETVEREGLDLYRFGGVLKDAPFTGAYMTQLRKSLPLPETTTFEALTPQLEAAGIDMDAGLASLASKMTPDELATVTAILAKPIPLEYTLSFDGSADVEPTTGAQVRVGSRDTYGVRPKFDEADLETVLGIVDKYAAELPAVASGAEALRRLQTGPSIPLAEFAYDQTPASIADIAADVKDSRQSIMLAQQWIPMGLLVLAAVTLLVGVFEWPRRGRGERAPVGAPKPTHA